MRTLAINIVDFISMKQLTLGWVTSAVALVTLVPMFDLYRLRGIRLLTQIHLINLITDQIFLILAGSKFFCFYQWSVSPCKWGGRQREDAKCVCVCLCVCVCVCSLVFSAHSVVVSCLHNTYSRLTLMSHQWTFIRVTTLPCYLWTDPAEHHISLYRKIRNPHCYHCC